MKKYLYFFFLCLLTNSAFAQDIDYYKKAQRLVGLEENSDRKELISILGVDPVTVPWCGYFMSYIFDHKTGLENPGLARNWLKLGKEVTKPKKGDLVIFSRAGSSWQGHVGFYVDTYKVGNKTYIAVLGGNQGDSIKYSLYLADNLLGYRRLTLS